MATYYVSGAAGNDANDGLGEGTAWATIDHAMNNVSAGDHVWVKADANYTETATIATAGTSTASIVFEGYNTTEGDGGKATIDGQSTRARGLATSLTLTTLAYHTFKNFIIKDHTTEGVNLSRAVNFWNCDFVDNGSNYGINARGPASIWGCIFSGHGLRDINLTGTGSQQIQVAHSRLESSNGIQCLGGGILIYGCVFRGSGTAIILGSVGVEGVAILNNTFDGVSGGSSRAIVETTNTLHRMVVLNNIFTRYNLAWDAATDRGPGRDVSRNNLFFGNSSNFSGGTSSDPIITEDPEFEDIDTGDYRLTTNSPARDAGVGFPLGQVQGMDIGAFQAVGGGAGGGGSISIKTGGQL